MAPYRALWPRPNCGAAGAAVPCSSSLLGEGDGQGNLQPSPNLWMSDLPPPSPLLLLLAWLTGLPCVNPDRWTAVGRPGQAV